MTLKSVQKKHLPQNISVCEKKAITLLFLLSFLNLSAVGYGENQIPKDIVKSDQTLILNKDGSVTLTLDAYGFINGDIGDGLQYLQVNLDKSEQELRVRVIDLNTGIIFKEIFNSPSREYTYRRNYSTGELTLFFPQNETDLAYRLEVVYAPDGCQPDSSVIVCHGPLPIVIPKTNKLVLLRMWLLGGDDVEFGSAPENFTLIDNGFFEHRFLDGTKNYQAIIGLGGKIKSLVELENKLEFIKKLALLTLFFAIVFSILSIHNYPVVTFDFFFGAVATLVFSFYFQTELSELKRLSNPYLPAYFIILSIFSLMLTHIISKKEKPDLNLELKKASVKPFDGDDQLYVTTLDILFAITNRGLEGTTIKSIALTYTGKSEDGKLLHEKIPWWNLRAGLDIPGRTAGGFIENRFEFDSQEKISGASVDCVFEFELTNGKKYRKEFRIFEKSKFIFWEKQPILSRIKRGLALFLELFEGAFTRHFKP